MKEEEINYRRSDTVELLTAYKHYIALSVIGLGIALALTGNLQTVIDVAISLTKVETYPVWVRLLVATIIGGSVLTGLIYIILSGLGLIDFTEPEWVDLYEVDEAREISKQNAPDEYLAHYKVAPDIWAEREIVEGKPYRSNFGHWTARFVEFEDGKLYVSGTWAGELTDVELASDRRKIEALRGEIRDWAVVGQNLYSKMVILAQGIESAYWRAMVNEDLEENTLHPEVIRASVVDELDVFVESIEKPGDKQDAQEVVDRVLESEGIEAPKNGDEAGDEQ
ncbi:hypothetical protein I7X12_07815 [Halosimplex litoreum]|uniref:Uncharacterized protein n=1 Tax=Halosimplex litoreum TaxID=1198301 RepID=A0A7T3G1N1_9EURY|nr:hypothetical protein [Halosimplex litoreum]QPV64507.1 hypothetical protein I7X12_07815 [Halosimplex litoreum]